MKLNTWYLLAAINWVSYAIGAWITPEYMLPNQTIEGGLVLLLLRLSADGAGSLGLLAWFARKLSDGPARNLISAILALAFGLGAITNSLGILQGTLASGDWIFVGVDALLALGFVYFRFFKPE